MSYFPFFREIEGEKCLVIGGGKVAARKISRLKGFGVKIKVVAPSLILKMTARAILVRYHSLMTLVSFRQVH